MRKLFLFTGIFFLFLYLFFKSGAWETSKGIRTTKYAATYMDIKHNVNWNRFFNYLISIPRDFLESLHAER